MANPDSGWVVYLLRCGDQSLYCGVTKDMRARLSLHRAGKGSKYVRSRLPVRLAFSTGKMPSLEAFLLERQVKRVRSDKKLEFLIAAAARQEKRHGLQGERPGSPAG